MKLSEPSCFGRIGHAGKPMPLKSTQKAESAYRMMMPEYYANSCLSCHGSPKGETDITGYPKEGGKEGDLGGVISVTLYKQ